MEFLKKNRYVILYFISFCSILFLISFTILFLIEKEIQEAKLKETMKRETDIIELQSAFLGRDLSMILSDI